MEQRLQNVLVPGISETIEFTFNTSWRREVNQIATLFGIKYTNYSLSLVHITRAGEDGDLFGELYAVKHSTAGDGEFEAKLLFTNTEWNTTHRLELGKDTGLYVVLLTTGLARKVTFSGGEIGDPKAFISPDHFRRYPWDVKIKLI